MELSDPNNFFTAYKTKGEKFAGEPKRYKTKIMLNSDKSREDSRRQKLSGDPSRHGFRRSSSLFSYLLISVLILAKFVRHQLKLSSKLIKI